MTQESSGKVQRAATSQPPFSPLHSLRKHSLGITEKTKDFSILQPKDIKQYERNTSLDLKKRLEMCSFCT